MKRALFELGWWLIWLGLLVMPNGSVKPRLIKILAEFCETTWPHVEG